MPVAYQFLLYIVGSDTVCKLSKMTKPYLKVYGHDLSAHYFFILLLRFFIKLRTFLVKMRAY